MFRLLKSVVREIMKIVLIVSVLLLSFLSVPPMSVSATDSGVKEIVLDSGQIIRLKVLSNKVLTRFDGLSFEGRVDVLDGITAFVLTSVNYPREVGRDGWAVLKIVISSGKVGYEYRRYEMDSGVWRLVKWETAGESVLRSAEEYIDARLRKERGEENVRGTDYKVPVYLLKNDSNCLSGIRYGSYCGPIYEGFIRYYDGELWGTGENSVIPTIEVFGYQVSPVRLQPALYKNGSFTKIGFGIWISSYELRELFAMKWAVPVYSVDITDLRIANLDVEIGVDRNEGGSYVTQPVLWASDFEDVVLFSPAKAYFYQSKPVLAGLLGVAGSVIGIEFPAVAAVLQVSSFFLSTNVRSVGWNKVYHGMASTVRVTTGYFYRVYVNHPVNAPFESGEWAVLNDIPRNGDGFYPVYASFAANPPSDSFAEIYGTLEIKGSASAPGRHQDFDIYVPVRLLFKLSE